MRVLLADDDPLVSESLKIILEAESSVSDRIEVAGIAGSGSDAVSMFDKLMPDVLLMDIRMDGMNGLDAGEAIIAVHPEAKILFLTTFLDDEYITRAVRLGAKGYILKQDCGGLGTAVRAVNDGRAVFGGKIVGKLPDMINRKKAFDYEAYGITEKECRIIEAVGDGLSNREIAAKLFLSEGTVRNAVSIILDKLELRDRTQLACFYYQEIKP